VYQSIEYHALQLLLIAREAVMRAQKAAPGPNTLSSDTLNAIVMSAASTEAFVNEFAETAALLYSTFFPHAIPPVITTCVQVLQDLEDSRVAVTTKYLVASQVLAGTAFDAGSAPFQDFKLLIDLRNAIMHMKPTLGGDRHAGQRIADVLGQRGLAVSNTGTGSLGWLDRLMTPAVAQWAHNAALEMIRRTLDLVPVRTHFDPLDSYRRFFRDYPHIT
jgi:hypothetical protein